ncbi:MAG: DUF5680 domain-containing protein [Patescibacteria group bacterium]
MNKKKLVDFLLKARTKTYAGNGGKVKPLLKNSKQLEYKEGEWIYRDVYYGGNGIFVGIETIYFKNKVVWSMSYYGNFKKMTEKEIDSILRVALLENWKTARIWKRVVWEKGKYRYICEPDFGRSIEEMGGLEYILKNKREVYKFFYTGGLFVK